MARIGPTSGWKKGRFPMSIFSKIEAALGCLVLTVFLFQTPSAKAGGCPQCATEFTQILNNVQLAISAAQEAKNLATNIQQYQTMLKSVSRLPQQIQQQALGDLQKLASIVAQGRAVAYSSGTLAEDYERQHRDFSYYENLGSKTSDNHEAYSTRYREWAESNHDSIRGALQAAGLQAQQFSTEASALKAIEQQIGSAVGQTQVLQAGASIAALQSEQLMKLRQLTMAQMQMQAADAGGRVEKQAEEDAIMQRARQPHSYNPDNISSITADDLF